MEIIVTATLFGLDVYVATDSYRPGKSTWLKYSPNTLAAAELHHSSRANGLNSHMFQDATLMLLNPLAKVTHADQFLKRFYSTDEVVELID